MVNKVIIQGRMCATPELRRTNSGTAVTSFTLAWSDKYKDTERKLFLPCVVWANNAEFCAKWFEKGAEVVVEGVLGSRQWQDKNGNNRETIELTVDRLHFCGGKREQQSGYSEQSGFTEVEDDGSLPF
jgi:single-strand DNA-binding protein